MKIQVEPYSGYKANERPIKFWIGDKVFFINSVEDQWRGSDALYFRILADDGNSYLLGYSESLDEWTLERSWDPRQKRE